MKTLDDIMYPLTGHGVIEALSEVLRTHDAEFAGSEQAYLRAVETLRNLLPADTTPSLNTYLAARESDIISRVAYAGYLGYRVNIEHFHHPAAIDFVCPDTIDYTKEHLIGHFPVNETAAGIRSAFHRTLPPSLVSVCDTLDDYFLHLECAGPRLAHYAGYCIANHLLPWVEPGYRPDLIQTRNYSSALKQYMGYLPF